MQNSLLSSILFATIVAGTPLIITALGELVTEKAGVLNLGAEGIMSMGAIAAFAVTVQTHNPFLGVLAGMAAGQDARSREDVLADADAAKRARALPPSVGAPTPAPLARAGWVWSERGAGVGGGW